MSSDTDDSNSSAADLDGKVAHIRYSVNWQGAAIKMQYERLTTSMRIDYETPVEEIQQSHMRAVADLDFLIISVRRLLRIAEQAKGFGLDRNKELRIAIKVFHSHWRPSLVDIRDSLEHVDSPKIPLIPIRGDGMIAFAYPGGQLDAGKLYTAAMELHETVCRIIEHFES